MFRDRRTVIEDKLSRLHILVAQLQAMDDAYHTPVSQKIISKWIGVRWGTIMGDIQDQEDLIALLDQLKAVLEEEIKQQTMAMMGDAGMGPDDNIDLSSDDEDIDNDIDNDIDMDNAENQDIGDKDGNKTSSPSGKVNKVKKDVKDILK